MDHERTPAHGQSCSSVAQAQGAAIYAQDSDQEGQVQSETQATIQDQGLRLFSVSLYMHISLFYGIVKLGLTASAGGPRESGQHAKVYFPTTHKAAFKIKLYCNSEAEAAKQTRRYETLAFHILSAFILCGEVCCCPYISTFILSRPPPALLVLTTS